jgi:hypothetical protein
MSLIIDAVRLKTIPPILSVAFDFVYDNLNKADNKVK